MNKNRIFFIVLFILALIFVNTKGGKIPYMLFAISFVLPLFSIVYTFVVFTRFKFIHDLDKKFASKGEDVKYSCEFFNEDYIFYPYIEVVFFNSVDILNGNKSTKRIFSLLPQKSKTIEFEVNCKYRGNYEFGVSSIKIEDFLGLVSFNYTVPDSKYLIVTPRLVKIRNLNIQKSYASDSETNLGKLSRHGIIMSDIRNYVYGDSFKSIHWKATSKTNSLMVKNYQETSNENVVIIIDLKQYNNKLYENIVCEDLIVESVLSLSHYCISNWIEINILSTEKNGLVINSLNDYHILFGYLSKVSFSKNYDVSALIKFYLQNQTFKSNFMFFVAKLTVSIYNQAYRIVKSGHQLSLVFINPAELNQEPKEYSKLLNSLFEIGVIVYTIKSSANIESEFGYKKII